MTNSQHQSFKKQSQRDDVNAYQSLVVQDYPTKKVLLNRQLVCNLRQEADYVGQDIETIIHALILKKTADMIRARRRIS